MPIILIGTKLDLRADPDVIQHLAKQEKSPVKWEDGYAMAEMIEAYAYLECSAKTGEGVRKVFETAARVFLMPEKNRRKFKNKNLQKKLKSLDLEPEPKKDKPKLSKLVPIECT